VKTPEEAKRNSLRDLFQSVLKGDMVLLSPVSITAKEVLSRNVSEVSFSFHETISEKKKKVNLKSVKGKGFVDCLFKGCKEYYSESYPSLFNINLVDLKVKPVFPLRGSSAGSDAETDIVLFVRVGDRGISEFKSRPDSIIRSAFTTTLNAFQFYINCEAAFEKIKVALADAKSRNRGDIQQRCLTDLSKITEMNYFKV
jgi:hypothetical protein